MNFITCKKRDCQSDSIAYRLSIIENDAKQLFIKKVIELQKVLHKKYKNMGIKQKYLSGVEILNKLAMEMIMVTIDTQDKADMKPWGKKEKRNEDCRFPYNGR